MSRHSIRLFAVLIFLMMMIISVSGANDADFNKFYGICFSPYMDGQDPDTGTFISEFQIEERIKIIAPYTEWIRTFGCLGGLDKTGKIAHKNDLKVAAGAWIGSNVEVNDQELRKLSDVAAAGDAEILIVGNEALQNRYVTEDQLVNYIQDIKSQFPNLPVTTAEPEEIWLMHPDLVDAVDIISVNIYPFWDGVDISIADTNSIQKYNQIVAISKGKPVIISELGWPTAGQVQGNAVPSPENAELYLNKMISWAEENNVKYFWFEAFDENWKDEGGVGPHWGIWDSAGYIKIPGTKTGSISVISNPWGATVYLDGTYIGVAPIIINGVNPGTHSVRCNMMSETAPHYIWHDVTVYPDQTTSVSFNFFQEPATGSISISSIPSGAPIYLDGQYTGFVTPITLGNVVPGTHTVLCSIRGAPDLSQTVTVYAGQTIDVTFDSNKLFGLISVNSIPSGAQVFLDGQYTGFVTPITLSYVVAETHTVLCRVRGYPDQSQTVTVYAGQTNDVTFNFDNSGSISVSSVPQGAQVFLDGQDTGFVTPITISNVVVGTHTVLCSLTGFPDQSKTVTVNAGQTNDVTFDFNNKFGLISVNSNPAGATVYLDGQYTGFVTPITLGNVVPGTHTVLCSISRYPDQSQTVTVNAGQTNDVTFNFDNTGSIYVSSIPSGAPIYLDGQYTGFVTPKTLGTIVPGTHTVLCIISECPDQSQTVIVYAGQTNEVTFNCNEPYGLISVSSIPSGAPIYLDGQYTGFVTPITLGTIVPGTHTVLCSISGAPDLFQTVTVYAGQTSEIIFDSNEQFGLISVNSIPSGAQVYLDGHNTGFVTPITLSYIVAGTHTVLCSLRGYPDLSQTITVYAGQTNEVSFNLDNSGSITVGSIPQGAMVFLDGEYTGFVTPITLNNVIPGTHSVLSSISGYPDQSQTVTVNAGQTNDVTFNFYNTGSVYVSSNPPGATVYLDGSNTGKKTPTLLSNVVVGAHTVLCHLTGFPDQSQTVTVYAGQTTSVYPSIIPKEGSIYVHSNLPGATVYLDGSNTGKKTPTLLSNVVVGAHTVLCHLTGFPDQSKTVTVSSDQTTSVTFNFQPPSIVITSITGSYLFGKVDGVSPDSYEVAVYIFVPGYGWVNKPYWSQPKTPIQNDGTYKCLYVTGGHDNDATQFIAFLVPKGTSVPLLEGAQSIPSAMYNYPYAYKRR